MLRNHFAVLVVPAVLMTACGTEPPTTTPPAPATSSSSPLPELRTELDAIGILLAACIPRLTGQPVDPVDNCANLMPDVSEVIGKVEQQADRLPEAARGAVGEVRRQLTEIAPCEPWFAAGGQTGDGQLDARCNQAWDQLYASYATVRKAA
ncbi:hypothetical protein YIM_32505 [Amycolatopsis sp. YIM 10]|nr:hypothetical protein YIM_32505 [Amycolatopsis sp. YIM 10]